jgi:hypothetical protein
VIACQSNGAYQICNTGALIYNAELVSDFSGACVEGQTWGINGTAIWVSGGCGGQFALQH